MTIAILEAVFGTLATIFFIWACWNEKRLIAWEDKTPDPVGKTIAKAFPKELQTMDFKIGDHVRGTAGSQGYYTQPGELLEPL